MKKLFTLLALLLMSIGSVWAFDTYTLTLNGSAVQSPAGTFFTTTTGGGFNTKYAGTYGGTNYTKGLKLNSSSSIQFTTLAKSDITIVQSTSSNGTNTFKLGGTVVEHNASGTITINATSVSYTMTENTTGKYKEFIFTDVPATTALAITHNSETGLFYVKVAYTEAAKTQLSTPEITFAPATGSVTIGTVANATKVTYTTDGTTPTAESTEYSAPFVVEDGTTVKAIAIGDNVSYTNSAVASELVLLTGITIADPAVNQYNGTVVLTCASPNATIEYSTDGGTAWNTYSRAFTLTSDTDLKVRASRASCTTSSIVDETITAVPANVKTTTIVMGFGAFEKTSKKVLTGISTDVANGYTLTMVTDQDKEWSSRNNITISEIGAQHTTFCGSNGVQCRLDLPTGVKATQLRLYSYVNSATSSTNCAWKEVNGVNLNSTLSLVPMGAFSDVADYDTNPDVRIFPLDNVEGSITFTNGGLQTCFVIVLDIIEPDVTITPAYEKTTYVTTMPLDFTGVDGLTAYVATSATASAVTIEEVDAAVPAGTPLLLVGTAATEYKVPVAAAASAPAVNLLKAGDGTTTFDGTTSDYLLASDGKFHQISEGTVAVGKAYLHLDTAPARELDILFGGETTGISEECIVKSEEFATAPVYNLNGQRVTAAQKGLYIVNGKKVVVK